jgi:hypothetical protein
MDFLGVFAPIIAIGLLIERILEAAWSLAEMYPPASTSKAQNPEQYGKTKQLISIVVSIILGLFISNALGIAFFAGLGLANITIDPIADKTITGAAAGAAAPYVHQIIELLVKTQKLLQTKKDEIAQKVQVVEDVTGTPKPPSP